MICLLTGLALPMAAPAQGKYALVVHGGAGTLAPDRMSAEDVAATRAVLDQALDAGEQVLKSGGKAIDAVQAAIVVLEESPYFNAGKGAVFNAKGGHELDASIMDGADQNAGAVAGVTTVRNPILAARAVMDHSVHVMLAGEGAERFADTQPRLQRVDNHWFDTPLRQEQLELFLKKQQGQAGLSGPERWQVPVIDLDDPYIGTVGAVALDMDGHIAAGTSTGGMTGKQWGRIGDSPVIGAGTWADARCGISGTGWGEFYIRFNAARDICARVGYLGEPIAKAADHVILGVIPDAGGNGGAVGLDADGNIVMPFSTSGMNRGWLKSDGDRGTAIFR
ncbi:isoaspartyl peptidase/L-asparaginase family protein [Pseudoxanthomonas kalamensis]|uniref:isoaspartyl peptidase/L-asparaginase family protein n=1 Tax=Pseudoxanthomonas kalamensis TaxID=289483 RepID=UPI001B8614C7|nr:isoaspartyl peptidase/L-asparaginase [Pseudoxanthomonas kalamensis]